MSPTASKDYTMTSVTTAISIADAQSLFAGITGCSFVRLNLCTIPKLSQGKKNPHQGRIRKYSSFIAFCGEGCSYERMMNNRFIKAFSEANEGAKPSDVKPFEAKSLWNGNGFHVAGAVLGNSNTGGRYVGFYVASNAKPKTYYELDGQPIAKADIIGLADADDEKIEIVDGQEIKIKFVVRTAKMESLKGFSIDGTDYMVVENI